MQFIPSFLEAQMLAMKRRGDGARRALALALSAPVYHHCRVGPTFEAPPRETPGNWLLASGSPAQFRD
jgi:hypothetical protein